MTASTNDRQGNPMQHTPATAATTATKQRTALLPPQPVLQLLLLGIVISSVCCSPLAVDTMNTEWAAGNDDVNTAEDIPRAWRLIKRDEWRARQPSSESNFTGPSPYVIVHHSYQPGVCINEDACKAAMRSMQNFHMDGHGWPDIGYTFAVGGDGNVYEARGYNVVGAHAPNYNSQSIGLLLIGNFVEKVPPAPMMQVAQDFIKYSVEIGQLREDYILYGHRQVRSTECPGDALYAEIQKWEHWREVS